MAYLSLNQIVAESRMEQILRRSVIDWADDNGIIVSIVRNYLCESGASERARWHHSARRSCRELSVIICISSRHCRLVMRNNHCKPITTRLSNADSFPSRIISLRTFPSFAHCHLFSLRTASRLVVLWNCDLWVLDILGYF